MKATLTIEMPERCEDCPCFNEPDDICNVEIRTTHWARRPDWCPLAIIEEIEDGN